MEHDKRYQREIDTWRRKYGVRRRLSLVKTLIAAVLLVGGFCLLPAQAEDPVVISAAITPVVPATSSSLEIGDQIKLVFYERLKDVEADKWGRGSSGFQERPELSGDFTVQDDGTISLPLLGTFQVQNESSQILQVMLADAFEKLTKRKGFATITALVRPPVYILGPVKTPGSFKFAPGMTVFHAVALAGGFDKKTLEPWQQLEAVRQTINLNSSYESMSDLFARMAVLKAERDRVTAKAPPQLVALVGTAEARKMIAVEVERRQAIVDSWRNRSATLAQTVAAEQQEVAMMSQRLHPLDELIRMRTEHANAYRSLMAGGNLSRNTMIEAQSELTDAELRKQDAINQISQARARLGQLEQEKDSLDTQTRSDLDTAISALHEQIAANQHETQTSDGILGALKVTRISTEQSTSSSPYTYEIIRNTATGPVTITAQGTTLLRPGDLVRISDTTPPSPPARTTISVPELPMSPIIGQPISAETRN